MPDQPNVQELWDREQIRECLYRYCRGIDRMDEATLRSVAWPEGRDQHGAFEGTAAGFVDWAMKVLPHIERSVHHVHNVMIKFQGDAAAAVESSFTALHRQPDDDGALVVLHMCGRYLDRFEKRAGDWRIADRQVVFDWIEKSAPTPGSHPERFGNRTPVGGRFPDDPVYAFLQRAAP
jgi:hypothetical protein